jgi:hypothetical protein
MQAVSGVEACVWLPANCGPVVQQLIVVLLRKSCKLINCANYGPVVRRQLINCIPSVSVTFILCLQSFVCPAA